MSIRGRMISSTSVLTKLTMPDSIWCSSRDEPRAQIDGVGQLLHRDLGVARRQTADASARAHQNVRKGIADPFEHPDGIDHHAGESARIALREDLRQDLTEEQQQECHQHRLEQELETREEKELVHYVRGEYDDADVHQIVGNQNRGQQTVDVGQHAEYGAVARIVVLPHLLQVARGEREERHLGPRHQSRDRQQHDRHGQQHGRVQAEAQIYYA